jgi:hypothetical protein
MSNLFYEKQKINSKAVRLVKASIHLFVTITPDIFTIKINLTI